MKRIATSQLWRCLLHDPLRWAASSFVEHGRHRPLHRHVDVASLEVDVESHRVRVQDVAASRFLATTSCRWTEQTESVTGAPTGSLRRRPRTTSAVRLRVVMLAVIGYLTAQGRNVFEEFGQSSVVRVRVELVRGMRDMVVDVMEQNSIGGAARGRDQLRGSWTSTASVPLQERQPALRVEKVAHCVRHGS